MSKISCVCGHVIRDQTDSLPYKAMLALDVDRVEVDGWIDAEIQSYVEAVKNTQVKAWLLERGITTGYLEYENSHASIVSDWILYRGRELQKFVYECESCGRLLVEGESNHFFLYKPDSEKKNGVLTKSEY